MHCARWALPLVLVGCGGAAPYWETPRAGANLFNEAPRRARFEAARSHGIELVRLAPNKWPTEARDFLVGDADAYRGLVQDDLSRLVRTLDDAHDAGLHVVLTTLTLPGARWRQHNDGATDARLFHDPRFEAQAARFWTDLASELRGHPALVGYNLLNEPRAPVGDVNRVSARLVAAVRAVDPETPIIVDVTNDADPEGFAGFAPLDDANVLYSFHFYQPWENTTWRRNQGRVTYPCPRWNRQTLEVALAPVEVWRADNRVPASRIFAAEVGCDRRVPGVERYLADAIALFEARGYHWAFYSFREDEWDGMDYERHPAAYDVIRRALARR